MKNSRFTWGMLIPLALIFSVALSVVYASKQATGQTRNKAQLREKLAHSVMWKPTARALNSSGSSVDVNLPALADKTDWIVGVVPVEDGGQEGITVGLVHWADRQVSKKFKIEGIVRIEDYPSDLIDVATGVVNVKGSNAIRGADTTLAIYLKVAPNTQVNLWQDGKQIADNSGFLQKRFAVKNGKPIGTPISSLPMLLTQLQTDRISKNIGQEVTINETNGASQSMLTPSPDNVNCTISGSGTSNGTCFDVQLNISCSDGMACSFQYGGCDWGDVTAIYIIGGCNQ